MVPRLRRYIHQVRERLQEFLNPSPPSPPKVVWLRGETQRRGLDLAEPDPPSGQSTLSVKFGLAHSDWISHWGQSLIKPIRRLWQHRGYHFPEVALEPAEALGCLDIALEVYGQEQHRFRLPHSQLQWRGQQWLADPEGPWNPPEVVQLELARLIWRSIPEVVTRDFAAKVASQQGLQVAGSELARLSRYLRAIWQAGLELPPCSQWLQVDPDDLSGYAQWVNPRASLSPGQRRSLLQAPGCLPEEESQTQAVEELLAAYRASLALPQLSIACRHLTGRDPERACLKLLRSCWSWDSLAWYHSSRLRHPRRMESLLEAYASHPVQCYFPHHRLGLVLESLETQGMPLRHFLEQYLGPIPRLKAQSGSLDGLLTTFLMT